MNGEQEVFKGKNFSDLLSDIYTNAKKKELQINSQHQSSQALSGSSSHTFYLLMEALDSLPVKFDLAIDTMRVGKNSVDLSGTVPNTQDQVTLDEAFQANGRFVIDKWEFCAILQPDQGRIRIRG